jgi:hypothetical protein
MPFEVTPFFPRLARFGAGNTPTVVPAATAANSTTGGN